MRIGGDVGRSENPGFTPPGYMMSPRFGTRRIEKDTFVVQRTQGLYPGLQGCRPVPGLQEGRRRSCKPQAGLRARRTARGRLRRCPWLPSPARSSRDYMFAASTRTLGLRRRGVIRTPPPRQRGTSKPQIRNSKQLRRENGAGERVARSGCRAGGIATALFYPCPTSPVGLRRRWSILPPPASWDGGSAGLSDPQQPRGIAAALVYPSPKQRRGMATALLYPTPTPPGPPLNKGGRGGARERVARWTGASYPGSANLLTDRRAVLRIMGDDAGRPVGEVCEKGKNFDLSAIRVV
jgi:hypothetical protein